MSNYRVRLLGPLCITGVDGMDLKAPTAGTVLRLLIALALRPGQDRGAADLSSIVWGANTLWPNIEVPMSRVRKLIPVPNKPSSSSTYRTTLGRAEVDATDFIDRIKGGPSALSVSEVDALLGLWRGDPEALYDFLPDSEFLPLRRGRAALIALLESWSRQELSRLNNLHSFRELFEAECVSISPPDRSPEKRLLIVDDDRSLTAMLEALLVGYQCVVTHSVAEAMEVVTDQDARLDGALVDLHLTQHMDSQGLAVIDALSTHRPTIPRVLMTSSPPPGGMIDAARSYGLYEVLVKNGADAPIRTRRTVDRMLSDTAESALRRTQTTFDTLAAQASRSALGRVVAARREHRLGNGEGADIAPLIDKLETLSNEVEEIRNAIASSQSLVDADALVSGFNARWSVFLSGRGGG